MKRGIIETMERIKLPSQESIRILVGKEKHKHLRILEANSIKQQRWVKSKQRVPLKNEKTSQKQTLHQKSHQMNQHMGSFPC